MKKTFEFSKEWLLATLAKGDDSMCGAGVPGPNPFQDLADEYVRDYLALCEELRAETDEFKRSLIQRKIDMMPDRLRLRNRALIQELMREP